MVIQLVLLLLVCWQTSFIRYFLEYQEMDQDKLQQNVY